MNYLKKLTNNKFSKSLSFSPRAFTNESARKRVEEIQKEHPDVDVKIKNIRVTDVSELETKYCAKVYFLVDISGSISSQIKEHFAAIQQGVLESLNTFYDEVEHGVILHHTSAKPVVTGFDWVKTDETGGTIVSSAYCAVDDIDNSDMDTDYYIVQLSDGDNWFDDNKKTEDMINSLAIDGFKGFKYFEVSTRDTQSLYKIMNSSNFVEVYRMKTGCTDILGNK